MDKVTGRGSLATVNKAMFQHDEEATWGRWGCSHSDYIKAGFLTASVGFSFRLIEWNIQLLNFAYTRLLNKPYENEVTLKIPPLNAASLLNVLQNWKSI